MPLPELTTSDVVESIPLDTKTDLVLIADNFVPKPNLNINFIYCFTGDRKKIVCAVPLPIRFYLKTDDIIWLKDVTITEKEHNTGLIALGKGILFDQNCSSIYLLSRGNNEYKFPKLLRPQAGHPSYDSLPNEPIPTDVVTYRGTLTKGFENYVMSYQRKHVEVFLSQICKHDNTYFSILVSKDVFLPEILRKGHIISATGREIMDQGQKFLLVSKKEHLFYEGMATSGDDPIIMTLSAALSAILWLFSKITNVVTYRGTLTKGFENYEMSYQRKRVEVFMSQICKHDNTYFSILVSKDVFLPEILRKGHIISATGREIMDQGQKFLLVSKKEHLFYEGMATSGDDPIIMALSAALSAILWLFSKITGMMTGVNEENAGNNHPRPPGSSGVRASTRPDQFGYRKYPSARKVRVPDNPR
uniref:Uncharacterized protein n=1 Tax=Panagrolaimus sp. JU765 TaxID=591449 RepID=A0AC34RRP8_9BILA